MTATSTAVARSWHTSTATSTCCALTVAASARRLSRTTSWSRPPRDERREEDGLERPSTRAARSPAVGVVPPEGFQGESASVETALDLSPLHVVRDRRQQLVEGDRVDLSERERNEIHQIAAVVESSREPDVCSGRSIEQAQRGPERHRDDPRERAHERQRQPARETSRRIDERQDPAVPLAGIEPRHELPALTEERRERLESRLWCREVVEHSDGVDEVHALRTQRRARQVSLDDMNVLEVGCVLGGDVHRRSEIDADDFLGAEPRGEAEVTALPAARVQHASPDEIFAADGGDPAEHLRFVLRTDLGEAGPLVAEALGGIERFDGDCGRQQARDASRDRVDRATGAATELALVDLVGIGHRPRQRERAAARRTSKPVEQAAFHAGRYLEAQ